MLVERGAVEAAEPVRVVREMPGHPIEDHGEARAMTGVDEMQEIGRTAEAARRREHPGRLVAPRSVERMLHHRQELDMGEAEVARVCGQLLGELAIRQPAISL